MNSFESVVMAGNGVAMNIEGFVYTAMNAQHQADMTFASQNYGAGKTDRVRKVLWCCLGTVTVIGIGMGLMIRAFGPQLIGLYNSEPDVIAAGLKRMDIILPTYFLCGLMDVMVGQLRGIGYSIMPMIVSLAGACVLRIIWIMTVFLLRRLSLFRLLATEYLVNILFDGAKLFFMILCGMVFVISFVFLRDKFFNFGSQCFGSRKFFDIVTLEIADCRLS